jgi:hypothetical protein
MLIASDPTACVPIDTANTTVVVYNTTVTANYTTNIIDYCDSLHVDFSAAASVLPHHITGIFGDGTTAVGPNVSHTVHHSRIVHRDTDCQRSAFMQWT